MAAPFLKWAGGKAKLVPTLAALLPPFERYLEPFLGGGAVFFGLEERGAVPRALLSDTNPYLIDAFLAVRDAVEEVIEALAPLAADFAARDEAGRRELYYAVREHYPVGPVATAAWLIFLNRTCYNGLFRVNAAGRFNVPYGRYKDPVILDAARLREASGALQRAELRCADFELVLAEARPGDFVYLDPPYQPLSATARFTNYTAGGFGPEDQERLARAFASLTERGIPAALSNSDHEAVRRLYDGRGYEIRIVPMSRAINSDGRGRSPVPELLVTNFRLVGVQPPAEAATAEAPAPTPRNSRKAAL